MIYDKQIIYGSIPSKSNSYKIVTLGGHGTLAKTKETKKYEESFFMQCSIRNTDINKRFKLTVDVYFSSDRPDLDNALKCVLDCLQAVSAIRNDRLCAEICARKLIDKESPRIEFTIETLIE
jgi:Holliday junction resolvase RusA-like endonuclease|nr:MAG TPA: Endodeoxyribonuclease RusA [Caudoviricetes sp.]